MHILPDDGPTGLEHVGVFHVLMQYNCANTNNELLLVNYYNLGLEVSYY